MSLSYAGLSPEAEVPAPLAFSGLSQMLPPSQSSTSTIHSMLIESLSHAKHGIKGPCCLVVCGRLGLRVVAG